MFRYTHSLLPIDRQLLHIRVYGDGQRLQHFSNAAHPWKVSFCRRVMGTKVTGSIVPPQIPRPFKYTAINAPFFIGECVLSCLVMVLI